MSGFFGAGLGALTFMTCHEYLTQQVYAKQSIPLLANADFRIKNMFIFTVSDFFAAIVKLPFEARKQLVQMANYDIDMKVLARNGSAAFVPLIFRDVAYRFIVQSIYYTTTTIEHRPVLKYSVP